MSDLTLSLDLSELEKLGTDLKKFEARVREEASKLSAMTHAHVRDRAQYLLKSRRRIFQDNLAFEQIGEDMWVVTVKQPAVWVEEGMPAHSMVDDLLRNNPRIDKKGQRFKIIPFDHMKGGADQTEPQTTLTDTVKRVFRQAKIPWAKIEHYPDGMPKTGLLHKMDIMDQPKRYSEGRGQGHGPVGQVMQGPVEGRPFLQGVRVYQRTISGPDGKPLRTRWGKLRIQRSIMTFRIVHERHRGIKWNYPGIEGMRFLDEAFEWAQREWDTRIVPTLVKEIGAAE